MQMKAAAAGTPNSPTAKLQNQIFATFDEATSSLLFSDTDPNSDAPRVLHTNQPSALTSSMQTLLPFCFCFSFIIRRFCF